METFVTYCRGESSFIFKDHNCFRSWLSFEYSFSTLLGSCDSQRLKITLRIVRSVIFPGGTILSPTSSHAPPFFQGTLRSESFGEEQRYKPFHYEGRIRDINLSNYYGHRLGEFFCVSYFFLVWRY
jgi:hypothetical protein